MTRSFAMRRGGRLVLAALLGLVIGGAGLQGAAARPAADSGFVEGVPRVHQWYNLTCEYAATAAVTWYYGNLVSQRTFINEVPSNPNPHLGFRGRVNGPVGGTGDYGVYAEPLVPVLEKHGFNADVVYGDIPWLKRQIIADRPVIVWMTYQARTSTRQYAWSDSTRFLLVPWEHCVVVTAYDNDGVTIMDPFTGSFKDIAWADFERAWDYFDNMSLLVTPQ